MSNSEIPYISTDQPLFFHAHTTLRDKSFLLTTPRLSIEWNSDTSARPVIIRDIPRKMLCKFCSRLKQMLESPYVQNALHLNSDCISLRALRELLEWMKRACSMKEEWYPQPGSNLSTNAQIYQGIAYLGVPYIGSDFYKSIQNAITHHDLSAFDVRTLWDCIGHNDKVIDHLVSTIAYRKLSAKLLKGEEIDRYLASQPMLKTRVNTAVHGLKLKNDRQVLRDKTNVQRPLQQRMNPMAKGFVPNSILKSPSPRRPSYAHIAGAKKEVKEDKEPQVMMKPKSLDVETDLPFPFPAAKELRDIATEDDEEWIFGWDQDGNRVMRRVM